mgnify:CR=1 FL=1
MANNNANLGVRSWGPEVDVSGSRFWNVAVVEGNWPNVKPVGKVYKRRSYMKALKLAGRMATDRKLELYQDAKIL